MTERNPEPGGHGDDREPTLPADEEAAWAEIVAGYGDEPDSRPDLREQQDAAADDGGTEGRGQQDAEADDAPPGGPVRSFTVYRAGTGPRDWRAPEEPDDDHFVPPEPPPLPEADTVTRFGWVAALGGPLLLVGAVLFGVPLSWWILTLGVGGFLGGFATLLTRLRDDDDFDDPAGGAVV
ncbi:hypothetical protein [Streptomyces sp. TR06-5]|uniref:hypothetical protein n=1 Tax=unclassified Streptomyces TaxID=2593676 RepID=UPI0039A38FFD